MKVLAVVLAAVVGGAQVFSQVSSTVGQEVEDGDLRNIEGEGIWFWMGIVALAMAIAPAAYYCVREAVEGRTPEWRRALALFATGTFFAAVTLYGRAQIDKLSKLGGGKNMTLLDYVLPYQPAPQGARRRF